MKLQGPWLALWFAFWYTGALIWLWWYVRMIQTGNAGASGIDQSREKHPVWFWFRVIWEGIWLIVFFILPLAYWWQCRAG